MASVIDYLKQNNVKSDIINEVYQQLSITQSLELNDEMQHDEFLQALKSINGVKSLSDIANHSQGFLESETVERAFVDKKLNKIKEDLGENDLYALRRQLKRGEIDRIKPKTVAAPLLKNFKRMKTVFCHSSNDEESWFTSQVYHVLFDHSGKYIITGGNDKLIKIFWAQGLSLMT